MIGRQWRGRAALDRTRDRDAWARFARRYHDAEHVRPDARCAIPWALYVRTALATRLRAGYWP